MEQTLLEPYRRHPERSEGSPYSAQIGKDGDEVTTG